MHMHHVSNRHVTSKMQHANASMQLKTSSACSSLSPGVMCRPEAQTKDAFETHFGTNHLAHFLLFQLLKPALLSASTPDFNSRVVSVSSITHILSPIIFDDLHLKKSGYHPHKAYTQSKTANIYLANVVSAKQVSASMLISCVTIQLPDSNATVLQYCKYCKLGPESGSIPTQTRSF